MTDEQKNIKEEFRNCCEGMPFAEMMRNMMDQKREGFGFDCAEMMRKMMDQEGGCCGIDCAEMMSQMMEMCCRPGDENEETSEKVKTTHTASQ